MLFDDGSFLERFARAGAAGFDAVEYLFPYAYDRRALSERLAGGAPFALVLADVDDLKLLNDSE